MKSAWATILFLACLSVPAFAAPDQLAMKQALQRDAQRCADLIIKQDYATIADCGDLRFIQRLGGQDKFVAQIKSGVEYIVSHGFQKESTTYELPSEIQDAGKFYYGVIHGRSVMHGTVRGKQGRVEYDDYELGISEDQGRNWKLLGTTGDIFSYYPELKGKIQLPLRQNRVFIPD